MNISEFCIRHPVATTLMSAALVVGRPIRLPVPARRGPAAHGVSRHQRVGLTAGRFARYHGERGGDTAHQAVLDHSRHRHHQRDELAGLHFHRHPVQPQSGHRQRGSRRSIGDSARAAPAPDRNDRAAELSQGQSGGCSDPDPDAAQRDRAAAGHGRLRAAGDLAGPLHHRRRGAGARSSAARSMRCECSSIPTRWRRAASVSTRCRRRVSAANANTPVGTLKNKQQSLTLQARDGAVERGAVPQHHRGHAQRQARAARRARHRHRTRSRTTRRQAGTTAPARSFSPSTASRKPTRSRWSTASGRCCRASTTNCPGRPRCTCSTIALSRSGMPSTTFSSRCC